MIQTCGVHYNTEHPYSKYAHGEDACGQTFDDATRMTICPHPRLDDPDWRKKIDDYLTSKGYAWSEAKLGYIKVPA